MRLPRAELTTRLLSRCGALSQDEGGAVLPQLITVTCRPCANRPGQRHSKGHSNGLPDLGRFFKQDSTHPPQRSGAPPTIHMLKEILQGH